MEPPLVEGKGLRKRFGPTEALRGLDLAIRPGEFCAVLGPSGAGKSTLLQILGLMDLPTEGDLLWEGRPVSAMRENERSRLRGDTIGFVLQYDALVAEWSVLDNVALPLEMGGAAAREARTRAAGLLADLGLSGRLAHPAGRLSSGERKRAAIARALIRGPRLLLADEPTGNLDRNTSRQVMELLEERWKRLGFALVVATHDEEVARRARRRVRMEDGKIL